MFTKKFLLDALERAIKAAAGGALLIVLGATRLTEDMTNAQVNALTIPWDIVAGFSLGAFVISLLLSVLSAPFGDRGTPSLRRKKQR